MRKYLAIFFLFGLIINVTVVNSKNTTQQGHKDDPCKGVIDPCYNFRHNPCCRYYRPPANPKPQSGSLKTQTSQPQNSTTTFVSWSRRSCFDRGSEADPICRKFREDTDKKNHEKLVSLVEKLGKKLRQPQ